MDLTEGIDGPSKSLRLYECVMIGSLSLGGCVIELARREGVVLDV